MFMHNYISVLKMSALTTHKCFEAVDAGEFQFSVNVMCKAFNKHRHIILQWCHNNVSSRKNN